MLSPHEEAVVIEVHNVLCDFVSFSPEAWAPIISKWSLQLLGELIVEIPIFLLET